MGPDSEKLPRETPTWKCSYVREHWTSGAEGPFSARATDTGQNGKVTVDHKSINTCMGN